MIKARIKEVEHNKKRARLGLGHTWPRSSVKARGREVNEGERNDGEQDEKAEKQEKEAQKTEDCSDSPPPKRHEQGHEQGHRDESERHAPRGHTHQHARLTSLKIKKGKGKNKWQQTNLNKRRKKLHQKNNSAKRVHLRSEEKNPNAMER